MDTAPATSHVSPLQGAKIVVANLQSSVTQEDIIELFGDVGALKRAKIVGHGQVCKAVCDCNSFLFCFCMFLSVNFISVPTEICCRNRKETEKES